MAGLRPIKYQLEEVERMPVDSSNATAIFKNSGVVEVADGNVDGWDGTQSARYTGVVTACYDSNGVELLYLPASTAGFVDVLTNPDLEIEIEAAAAIAETARFSCADLDSNAGNTSSGNSTAKLSATIAVDDQFKIVGLVEKPDNAWGDADVKVRVIARLHARLARPNGI